MTKKWISIEEYAKIKGIARTTPYTWIALKKIPKKMVRKKKVIKYVYQILCEYENNNMGKNNVQDQKEGV